MPEPDLPQTQPSRGISPGLAVMILFALFGLIAAVLVAVANSPAASGPKTLEELTAPRTLNWEAPDFELANLDGDTVRLSDYRGRVVFVNFWATWCGPCVAELPAFYTFSQQQGEDGAVILAVNAEESPQTIRDFFAENDIGMVTVLLDTDSAVRRRYSVGGMPMTYIIDAQGKARFVKLGGMSLEDMQGYLKQIEG